MDDWMYENLGWVLLVGFITLSGAAYWAMSSEHSDFMAECTKEGHSDFECRVLYKQTHPPAPVVVHH